MTISQALSAELFGIDTPTAVIEKILIDNRLDGNNNYSDKHEEVVKTCAIQALRLLLSTPDVTEGDMSIKYDRKAIQARLTTITTDSGGEAVVRGLKPW